MVTRIDEAIVPSLYLMHMPCLHRSVYICRAILERFL
jgi:hypothetical protein